ncbi:MAG: hypothetical protein JKY56_18675, partial [Kofleriaceae bacterium]|nr:hypothetical protein [Kofleriaceae bacterium]
MDAQKPDTADTQAAALPASLAFVPQDASTVFRLDLAKTMQSFLWTDLLGPQVDALTDSVEGCDSNVVNELSDIVVAVRRSDSDEESDWEARFSTTGSRRGLVRCLEALVPLFDSFTIEKTGDGFEVHSQGSQLAWD